MSREKPLFEKRIYRDCPYDAFEIFSGNECALNFKVDLPKNRGSYYFFNEDLLKKRIDDILDGKTFEYVVILTNGCISHQTEKASDRLELFERISKKYNDLSTGIFINSVVIIKENISSKVEAHLEQEN